MEPVTDAQSASNTLSATIMGGGNSSGSGATSAQHHHHATLLSPKTDAALSPLGAEAQSTSKDDDEDSSNPSDCKSPGQRYVNL